MAPVQKVAVLLLTIVVVSCHSIVCETKEDICDSNDNELLSWLKDRNLYQIDIIQALQSYGIETTEQIESLPKNKLNEIWQDASLQMYQRFAGATQNTESLKPTKEKSERNQEELDTVNEYRENIRPSNEEAKLFTFLEENHLNIFKDVCKKQNMHLDELKWSNTTHVAQLLHDSNQNKSTVIDVLRLKSCIIKLKNDLNVIYSDNKNLAIKRSKKNIFNEERDILEQITSEQLKMRDFIDVLLSILDQTDTVYNKQKSNIRKYHQQIANRVQTRKEQLSASLDEWKYEKTEQLSQAVHDVEIYVTSLQNTLNQSYNYIEDGNLLSRERKKLLTQQSNTLSRMYPKYQNLSQFSEYVNDVASSVVFDASNKDSLTDTIDTFGAIMTDEVRIIPPSIKLEHIVPQQSRTSIVWSYKNFNFEDHGKADNHTICSEINLYVQNIPVTYGWSSYVLSQRGSITRCAISADNDVLLKLSGSTHSLHAPYTFRIEYEMLSPIKLTVFDEMTNQRNVLHKFLNDHQLGKFAHVFEKEGVYLSDIFAFNGSVNEILDIGNWNLDKSLLVTSIVKWKSDENIKRTKRMAFDMSTSLPLREEQHAVFHSFQKEQIKMNKFLQIILNATAKLEQLSEDVIDDAFNKLVAKKKNLISELSRIKFNKLNKINAAVTAVEKYNLYLQKHLTNLYENMQDSNVYSEKRSQIKPFDSSHYINDINTEISFDDTALRNFGEIKLQNAYAVPILTILNGETDVVTNGTNKMFMHKLQWEYKHYEDNSNICNSIHTYIDSVEHTTFTSKLIEHQSLDDGFKTVCFTLIEGLPFSSQNHTYTFKIERSLQFPLEISIYDTYAWRYQPGGASSRFMIYVLILLAMGFLTVMAFLYGPTLKAKSSKE